MKNIQTKLSSILNQNKGYLFLSKALKETKISKPTFYSLVKEKDLVKVSPGVFCYKSIIPDEYYLFLLRHSEAVLSHGTALYLLGYSDRDPLAIEATVHQGANPKTFEKAKIHYVPKERISLGLTKVSSPQGFLLRCYGIERTLVDLLRNKSGTDPNIFSLALKKYVASSSRNIPELLRIAKIFRVNKQLEAYLEVLL